MRRRRTGSGVGGRAGAVSRRRRARRTAVQRSACALPVGGVRNRCARSTRTGRSGIVIDPAHSCLGRTHEVLSLGTECATLGYSEYSHGVSRAWTRVGGTREGTVSGNTPVLA
jgi:hypothetical protein